MIEVELAASVRQNFGKGAMRCLRREGQTPAILYGPKSQPLPLTLPTKEFTRALLQIHGQNAVVNLKIDGEGTRTRRQVILQEVQADPVQDTVIHADFLEIAMDEARTLPVPVRYVGTPKGVDQGGVLHVVTEKVRLRGLPLDIPDYIEADVTSLELGGHGLTCKDLVIPPGIALVTDGDTVCANVASPSKAVATEPAAEEAAAGAGTAEKSGGKAA